MNNTEFIKAMRNISKDRESTDLKKKVASMLINQLDGYDNPKTMFNDLLSYGCASGQVGDLIYYYDTHKFAKRYIEDILELKADIEDSMGEPVQEKDDRLNWLAWFGFEEQARIIADDLRLGY